VRTKILAWILVAMLVGVAVLFGRAGKIGHAIVIGGVPLLLAFGITYVKRVVYRANRRGDFMRDAHAAQEAAARGDLQSARMLYDRWRTCDVDDVALGATMLTVAAEIRLGLFKDAIATAKAYSRQPRLPPQLTAQLAIAHALSGDVEGARGWLARTPHSPADLTEMPVASLAFARAVIDCRTGRHADAAKHLDEHWPDIERTLRADSIPPYRVVRAFARAHEGVRSAGLVDAEMATARSTTVTYLGTSWPEMMTFLAAHQLVDTGAPPAGDNDDDDDDDERDER
jgi:hypothetical protein